MRERLTAGLHAFTRRTRTSGDLIRASDTTQRMLLVTIVLTALAFALRIYRLDAQSLWLDEGSTWVEVTGKGWLALVAELFSPNAGYPLYHLLLKAWVLIAGDAEWALRFPSALAGALVVPALMAAVGELSSHHTHTRDVRGAAAIGALVALSPYALWHAQDAKVYSLVILASAALLWTFLRAFRLNTQRAWLLFAAVALTSVFVHRLALLSLAGAVLVLGLHLWQRNAGMQRWSAAAFMAIALVLSLTGVAGTILATRNERIGSERSAVGIVEGIWFTFAHFSLDRWPGDLEGYLWLPTFAWFLPWAVLTLWGVALLCRDARAGRISASAIVALLIAPVGLFAIVHTIAPVYEARYVAPAFPAWLVALVYPILAQRGGKDRVPMSSRRMLPDALAPVPACPQPDDRCCNAGSTGERVVQRRSGQRTVARGGDGACAAGASRRSGTAASALCRANVRLLCAARHA
jgi:mannosyltransferase